MGTLVATLQELGSPATIALEASGHYWQGLYHHLVSQGFSVIVVNPVETETYRSTRVRYVAGEMTVQLGELTRYGMDLEDQIGDA